MLLVNDKLNIGLIAISHDSKLIGIENINDSIYLWSVESMKLLYKFNIENKKNS